MRFSSPVVIGRDSELRVVNARLTTTRASSGGTLFLIGEAGIGKTRLAEHCARAAAGAGMELLRGRSSSTGPIVPFRPLTEAIFSLSRTGRLPDNTELAPYRPALARLIPEWRDPAVPERVASIVELAEAVLRLVTAVAGSRGCVLILEDIHDADAETHAVVEYLVDNLADLPILMVATMRPGSGPATDLAWAAAVRRSATVVELHPLSDQEVHELASACLDTDALPVELTDRLVRDSEGNPFVAEELLNSMIGARALVRDGDGWRFTDDPAIALPNTVTLSVTRRLAGLDPQARTLLHTAAVLGRRFPVAAVRAATGLEERAMLSHLRSGVDVEVIMPDRSTPDWYSFRHALTADAILATLTPAERSALAKRAADALEAAYAGLPGHWCQLAAELRQTAGDNRAAGLLFAEAGRRALGDGATTSAVTLLDRAYQMMSDPPDPDARAGILESLLNALAEAGHADRAFALVDDATWANAVTLGVEQHVSLRTRLAWVAVVTGRWSDGASQVRIARAILGSSPPPGPAAQVDVVEAHLIFGDGHGCGRTTQAEQLVLQALAVAELAPMAETACQALQLLAMIARGRSFDEAESYLTRMLMMAEEHRLPLWRINALFRLGVNQSMRTGEQTLLRQAEQAAQVSGAIMLRHSIEGVYAIRAVMQGDYPTGDELAARCAAATARLRNIDDQQFALVTAAASAAHRGQRRLMELRLEEFRAAGGGESGHVPLAYGFCEAVCALLEEDRPAAIRALDLARAWEDDHPNTYYMTGRFGLRPLLDALAGSMDRTGMEAVALAPAATLRWNRQFLHLAKAVVHGRAGQGERATAEVALALDAAAPYRMTFHLGLRLVAEAALADGWGEPVSWLRAAEDHFHNVDAPVIAGACRGLLRQAGASLGQRRSGHDRIPTRLRAVGVTVREHEVLVLLAKGHDNQDLATLLHLSPRTVEKHVASLLLKTGHANRRALRDSVDDLLRTDSRSGSRR
ncbi:helix-turn-helix transcriptional regulator [Micromonospora peucetia]|uniref:AAA family ATPase n=1 Tax=Micromonospora peucetia TaxID=47871 RepID=A0A1C6VVH1_9ACTN|nr:LuxR family transcriptional regulator [Micromonospora peucetia]WSA31282.1 AAA family ATPase [Micromonospora peucetia]SCL70303.1 regulatory protein, luxR family [Micromonospora peucetia]